MSINLRFDQVMNATRSIFIHLHMDSNPYLTISRVLSPLGIVNDLLSEVIPTGQIEESIIQMGLLSGWYVRSEKIHDTTGHTRITWSFRMPAYQHHDWVITASIFTTDPNTGAPILTSELQATALESSNIFVPSIVVHQFIMQWMILGNPTAILSIR